MHSRYDKFIKCDSGGDMGPRRGLTNDQPGLAQNFNYQNDDDNCSESVHKECFTRMRLHLSWPDV